MTVRYRETASASGAWHALLQPTVPIVREHAHTVLAATCTPDTPVTAAIQERRGLVERLALLRDPSATHGTPSVEDYRVLTGRLVAVENWHVHQPHGDWPVVVMLGLREGYDPDAAVRTRDEFARALDSRGVVTDVHLFNALDREIRTYDEPGVLIGTTPDVLPEVAELAATFRQERFVVTDYDRDRTYAMGAKA